jgi:hypothetical protein
MSDVPKKADGCLGLQLRSMVGEDGRFATEDCSKGGRREPSKPLGGSLLYTQKRRVEGALSSAHHLGHEHPTCMPYASEPNLRVAMAQVTLS